MGLPWVRLDTQFATNPKIISLISEGKWRTAFVYVASIAYCGAHSTDGYIPKAALKFIHATNRNATEAVKVELWDEDVGGWHIHDWDEFQVSDDAARDRRDRARRAALSRWRPDEQDNDGL